MQLEYGCTVLKRQSFIPYYNTWPGSVCPSSSSCLPPASFTSWHPNQSVHCTLFFVFFPLISSREFPISANNILSVENIMNPCFWWISCWSAENWILGTRYSIAWRTSKYWSMKNGNIAPIVTLIVGVSWCAILVFPDVRLEFLHHLCPSINSNFPHAQVPEFLKWKPFYEASFSKST